MSAINESLKIAEDFIAVKYKNASAEALRVRCATWFVTYADEELYIRASGFRIAQKLDLLDKAKDRVIAVHINCIEISK